MRSLVQFYYHPIRLFFLSYTWKTSRKPYSRKSDERAQRDAPLQYVVIYGAACSYCLARAEWNDGSYLRTFALELKEQLVQTLTAFVTSILT
ncbi:MAG: hypothetical protein ACXV3E_03195 [Halobacteriota archaeon]